MEYKLKIYRKSREFELSAPEGVNLHRFLHQNNFEIYSPCNSNGTCGKCMVRLKGDSIPGSSQKDRLFLGDSLVAKGWRLACQTLINCDMTVYLDSSDSESKVLTSGKQKRLKLSPLVRKEFIRLCSPDLQDQRCDSTRLKDYLKMKEELSSLHLIRQLPETLRKENFNSTLLFFDKEVIGIEEGDTTSKLYGIAIDIGTTTLAAYLIDLKTGIRVSTYSCLNPQKKFGADVISRIKYTMEEPNGLLEMYDSIINSINLAVDTLTKNACLESKDVYEMTLVGNTTMLHFLMKIPARNIASAPFAPAATQEFVLKTADLGIKINKNAVVIVAPSVAAYIGADTVSAVIASGMDKQSKISLLVDFGTNGEIVLGCKEWLLSCSAAAGPAFEGANIRCGVGSIKGAIDSFSFNEDFQYTTINKEKPSGICGTGVIDIVSELYKTGIIDETGRMETDFDKLEGLPPEVKRRFSEINGTAAFIIADSSESTTGNSIYITQKDVRELQNAKGAIAAGIRVLIEKAGIGFDQVDRVYLAGGFGTYVNTESALNIGLIPAELRGKPEPIGNAAGMGAIEMLLSKYKFAQAKRLKKYLKYIELSSCKEFNDFYMDSMMF